MALSSRIGAHGRAVVARQRVLFADIAAFERSEAWRADEALTMAAWLAEELGIPLGTARAWVRAARQIEELPHLAEAFATGALSLEVVIALAAVLTPATDAEVVGQATEWSAQQVRDYAASLKPPTDAVAAREFEQRSLRFNDAQHSISILFPTDDYAEYKAKVMAGLSWDGSGDSGVGTTDANGEYLTFDQRCYDSHMNICRADAIAKEAMGTSGARQRSRATVVVHAPLATLMGEDGGAPSSVAGGGLIAPEVARRLSCDAEMFLSIETTNGTILDQGRLRKEPSRRQRIEIARRDGGCRFANCSHTDFVHVHHIVHWAKGGRTDLDNLITLCPRHHHAVHEVGWKMSGNANETITFTSPHGRSMTSVPVPTWRPMRT